MEYCNILVIIIIIIIIIIFRYMYKEKKMKYSYTRNYREQNSRDYNDLNVQFLNQRVTAKVVRAFFNLGSFSMYNQRDNVFLGGGGHIQVFLEARPIPAPPAPLLPFIYVLCLDKRCSRRSPRRLMSCPLAREFYIHSF